MPTATIPPAPRPRRFLRRLARALGGLLALAALAIVLVVFGSAFSARSHIDLGPWHRWHFAHEVDAAGAAGMDWAGYLRKEDALFAELAAARAAQSPPGDYRYQAGSRIGAPAGAVDWNRSYAGPIPARVRGGVLLLHGLSDSPYSLHDLARHYEARGFVVLMPRLPGHGTAPSGLLEAQWQDWLAVVELSMRELRARTGAGKPLHMVGYSNGGALALKYAMDRADGGDDSLPRPDRLVLLSPMIGVGAGARFARLMPLLSGFDYFEKSLWLDVQPEFNPFKYNSFPVNAVRQSWGLTTTLQAQLLELRALGRTASLPPVLTFQSVLDSTVSTPDVVHALYARLPGNGSELVLFDLNRRSLLAPMFKDHANRMLQSLRPDAGQAYRLTTITNRGGASDVEEQRLEPGSDRVATRALPLAWPTGVYSLSHIALPFPVDDPLYGLQPRPEPDYGIRIGTLELRGERGALSVGAEQLQRIASNPFHPYLIERIDEGIRRDTRGPP